MAVSRVYWRLVLVIVVALATTLTYIFSASYVSHQRTPGGRRVDHTQTSERQSPVHTHHTHHQRLQHAPSNVIYVRSTANFTERIHQLNVMLDLVRQSMSLALNESMQRPNKIENKVIIRDDSYPEKLRAFPHITTIVVGWQADTRNTVGHKGQTKWSSLGDTSNVLIQRYYPWTGTHFCHWLQTNERLEDLYVGLFRKLKCSNEVAPGWPAKSVEFGHLKVNSGQAVGAEFLRTPPDILASISVVTGGVLITADGHVVTGNVTLVFDYCRRNSDVTTVAATLSTPVPEHDEVFAMRSHGAGAFYHGMCEELPRAAPFVEFLRRHAAVKIHVSDRRRAVDMLRVAGLGDVSTRVINGVVRAKVAYVPRPATCMMPRLTETQLMSAAARHYIRTHLQPLPSRNTVLFINRSGERHFIAADQVIQTVQVAATRHNLEFAIFGDNPVPSLNDTMRLFQSAVMVVAGHGAGLSNIVFCQPGTVVVEVLPTSRILPLCYLQLAHVLGLRWHGLPAVKGRWEKIVVSLPSLSAVLDKYLQHLGAAK